MDDLLQLLNKIILVSQVHPGGRNKVRVPHCDWRRQLWLWLLPGARTCLHGSCRWVWLFSSAPSAVDVSDGGATCAAFWWLLLRPEHLGSSWWACSIQECKREKASSHHALLHGGCRAFLGACAHVHK